MKKKESFLVLKSGKFLEALGGGIGTGSVFCLSFSLSNRVGCLLYQVPDKINNYNSIVSLISTLWNDLTAIDHKFVDCHFNLKR